LNVDATKKAIGVRFEIFACPAMTRLHLVSTDH